MVEFLEYIAKSMLIVNRENRDKSRLVERKQLALFNKCRKDERYATSSATPSHEMSLEQRRPEEGPREQGEVDTDRRQKSPSTSRFLSGLCCCK